jgi:NAD(P)-dependent dehydrogenase (short-subunit alcohol dehydrogenase family)
VAGQLNSPSRGTEGSNPAPSSGESRANLTSSIRSTGCVGYQGHLPNAAGVPLGRQGSVDEIAATCLFLVSEDAGFITGQTIHVNGGAHYY